MYISIYIYLSVCIYIYLYIYICIHVSHIFVMWEIHMYRRYMDIYIYIYEIYGHLVTLLSHFVI